MPSHIYLRVGRYHDAVDANRRAALADEDYIAQCNAQGFYPAAYYPHNVHFLYASSAFEGRSAVSIGAARKLSANITPDPETGIGTWTDEEIKTVLTTGKRRNGLPVKFDLMPWWLYQNLTPEDLDAIVAYLRSLEPVQNDIHAKENQFPLGG